MKRVAILGCTGSIGTQTLDVLRTHSNSFQVAALSASGNVPAIARLAREFPAAKLAMFDESAARMLAAETGRPVLASISGLEDIACDDDIDIVVIAVAGVIGLRPTIAAIQARKLVALASKEVLVAGGEIVMSLAKSMGVEIRPIDSEHSAIRQCLDGAVPSTQSTSDAVDRIVITASGGPFRGWTLDQLSAVTPEQALNHPTWRMGGKITVDSATLMNKGLEVIEACWLYGLPEERVDVVVHPQSVVHSMVHFADGSVLAQLGHPDMKMPIQYALCGEHVAPRSGRDWDPFQSSALTFESYDSEVFRCPSIAREAFRRGGLTPTYVNAVNEEAANAFLVGKTSFVSIQELCEECLDNAPSDGVNMESILRCDADARVWAQSRFLA